MSDADDVSDGVAERNNQEACQTVADTFPSQQQNLQLWIVSAITIAKSKANQLKASPFKCDGNHTN